MWCRFALFAFCCIAAGNCISAKDGEYGGDGDRREGSHSPLMRQRNFGREGQPDFDKISTTSMAQAHQGTIEDNSSDSQRNYEHQDKSTPKHNAMENSKSSENPSSYGEEHLSGRLTGQSNRREDSHHSTEQSFRPIGESFHNRPERPSHEGTSTGRPLESSTFNREGNKRPSSGNEPSSGRAVGSSFHGPSNQKGHLSGRPTEESFHTTDHSEGVVRPMGFRPDNAGEHFFSRPTGGSSATTNHNNGDKRPGGSRPSDETMNLGGPTGESTHSQQAGHQGGHSGHSAVEPDQFTTGPDEQSGTLKSNETGKDGKEDADVCFPNLGCFDMGKPWKSILRPIGAPHGPEKILTTIHFYSRANLERQKNITVYPQINMGEVQFDSSKITAVIVHGFSNSGNATWMKDMKNAYLSKVDANVMIVDWGKGAQLLNYLQVAGNTRVVGKQLSLFIKYLKENYGADPGKFHLIGHSLGAQICSYLAKEVPGIARLTALDPAQPGFEGFDSALRLDKSDAEFVDVIHTDARPFIPTLGFGMIAPHGHVDFYMNGGFDQPGCIPPPKKEFPTVRNFLDLAKYPVEVIAKTVACPHGRAYEYLIESFNETEKCIFWGHKADVKNVFKSVTNTVTQGLLKKFTALSTTCSKEDCIPLGFATKKSPLRGVFVVTTANRPPYCISEPGIPPETPPQERRQESFIQKIGKKTGLMG